MSDRSNCCSPPLAFSKETELNPTFSHVPTAKQAAPHLPTSTDGPHQLFKTPLAHTAPALLQPPFADPNAGHPDPGIPSFGLSISAEPNAEPPPAEI